MNDRRPPESPVLSADTLLPFSKGLMARALMGTGIAPERAYELARFVEVGLSVDHPDLVAPSDAVYDVAAAVLSEHEDEEAVRRLRRYQRLQEVESPLVLLVGGATGTGKSTITTEVAHRLGINRVTSTDFVRQTMRAFFSEAFMPSIHYSSFEAGTAVAARDEDPGAANVRGFLEQTRNVLVGVRASVERALTEGHSMAIEGVHLVPGLVPNAIEGAHRVPVRDRDPRRGGARAPLLRPRARLGRSAAGAEVPRRAAGDPPHPGSAHRARGRGRRAGDRERRPRAGGRRGAAARARHVRARQPAQDDRMTTFRCEAFAGVTERAAVAAGRWLGRGDVAGAEEAAALAMRAALDTLPIEGRVMVGTESEDHPLRSARVVGAGGDAVDLAVDPSKARRVVARGDVGAMSMLAVGDADSFPRLPNMYMRKMAVGPTARGRIDLSVPVGDNVRAIAEAFGRNVGGHHDDRARPAAPRGPRRGAPRGRRADQADPGRGRDRHDQRRDPRDERPFRDRHRRRPPGRIAAAALRCLGGELQAQLWPVTRTEIDAGGRVRHRRRRARVHDRRPRAGRDDRRGDRRLELDLLRGVHYFATARGPIRMVMCTRHNWVKFVDGIHFFARERREEVRLS